MYALQRGGGAERGWAEPARERLKPPPELQKALQTPQGFVPGWVPRRMRDGARPADRFAWAEMVGWVAEAGAGGSG